MNIVLIEGTLLDAPAPATLADGRQVLTGTVTVRDGDVGGAESVPFSWFDPPARASGLGAGERVALVGRVRRRFFRTGGVTASRTDVVVEHLVRAGHRRRLRARLDRAVAELAGTEAR